MNIKWKYRRARFYVIGLIPIEHNVWLMLVYGEVQPSDQAFPRITMYIVSWYNCLQCNTLKYLYVIEPSQAKFNKIRYYILYIGVYPEYGQKSMTACMVGNSSSMCIETWKVEVKKCRSRIYMYLMPTAHCGGYCMGKKNRDDGNL